MRTVRLCLVLVILVGSSAGMLTPSGKLYKICILLPFSSKSHKNFMMVFAESLADRGHKVVMLTMHPATSKHPNITEIYHGIPNKRETSGNMFESRKEFMSDLALLQGELTAIARDLYKVPSVKKLYEKRKEFDLMVVDHMFNEIGYPFVHDVPFITVAIAGMDPRQSAVFGNVLSPSYVPNLLTAYSFPMSVWQRLINTFMHICVPLIWRNWAVVPMIQKEIKIHFPDLPPLLDIERNQSLTLMNTHFSITSPVPLLPSQVEVGALHCRPANTLPPDLELWLEGAGSAGVIYFSLGSITRGETMPAEYRQAFLEAFNRLPQRVLWKYEGKLEGVSDNVRVSSWLPQQDVLAHHNVKVFISHGGLLSLQESIFHVTPLLILPIFGDQTNNGMLVDDLGLGRVMVWEELTADKIVDALTDIITNLKYKKNVVRLSSYLKDQLITPQDSAVFWTEYVIRHQAAPKLKCPAAQLSWVEFLLLDVIGLLLLTVMVLLLLLRRLLKIIFPPSMVAILRRFVLHPYSR